MPLFQGFDMVRWRHALKPLESQGKRVPIVEATQCCQPLHGQVPKLAGFDHLAAFLDSSLVDEARKSRFKNLIDIYREDVDRKIRINR